MSFGQPLAVLAILCVFLGLGAGAERIFAGITLKNKYQQRFVPAFWLVSGWGIFSFTGVIAALGNFDVAYISAIAAILGVIGFILFVVAGRNVGLPLLQVVIALLLLAPLLWIVATTPATIYDEFGQWLPNARFLYEHRHFATVSDPNLWSYKPSYPPAMPLVIAAGSILTHGFAETIGKLLLVIMAACFGIILGDLFSPRLGRWPALVAGVALATLLNPFFDPRISLTTYADAPTGFVLALTVFAAWNALRQPDAIWRWRAAAGVVLLILLRETNIVLVAGLFLGVATLAINGERARAARLGVSIGAAAILPLAAWRIYLQMAKMPPAMAIRPVESWDWHAPGIVLDALFLDRLFANPLLGGVAVLCLVAALGAGIWFIRHSKQEFKGPLILFGSVMLTWLLFLTFCYIAVFSPSETARAASAWRYLSQLGPSLLLVLAVLFGAIPMPLLPVSGRAAIAAVMALFVVLLQLSTWNYWRIDCRYADVVAVRRMAGILLASGAIDDEALTVINPVDAPAYAVQLDYDLHRAAGRSQGRNSLDEAPEGLILDLTQLDRAVAYKNRQTPSSLLFRKQNGALSHVLALPPQPIEGACHVFQILRPSP